MKRKLIAILLVGLFITLGSASMVSANPRGEATENVLTIVKSGDGAPVSGDQLVIDESAKNNLEAQIYEFKTWIEQARPFQDFVLTEEEKTEIVTQVTNLIDSVNAVLEELDQDPIEPAWVFNEMFETELGRSTIVSVGVGYAFIPFYDYESFYGIMFRPIWLIYPPWFMLNGGYTGNLNINIFPPRIEYGDRLGSHIVRTTFFSGLYMNIGDLGYDNIFGGPMILLGRARVVMSGDL